MGRFTDRLDAQTERVATVGLKWRGRIVTALNQFPAQRQNRRTDMHSNAARLGGVVTGQFADNQFTLSSALSAADF
jgi:hypothetical protein